MGKSRAFSWILEKGQKKGSKKWSFWRPQNVKIDQNLQIFDQNPYKKWQVAKSETTFDSLFFRGEKFLKAYEQLFAKTWKTWFETVQKREITVLTVLTILGFLKIHHTVNDVFFNFCHFWFVFFCVFWRQKVNFLEWSKVKFWRYLAKWHIYRHIFEQHIFPIK